VHLVPKVGPKTEAGRSLTFVREADLSDEQKAVLQDLGRTGSVVVREQVRPVASAGLMRPSRAVALIQERIPFVFNMHHFVLAWQATGARPKSRGNSPGANQ
jgi:hypothetical protein